eukprot:1091257-Ditylum_brightwellii.AAC.1
MLRRPQQPLALDLSPALASPGDATADNYTAQESISGRSPRAWDTGRGVPIGSLRSVSIRLPFLAFFHAAVLDNTLPDRAL